MSRVALFSIVFAAVALAQDTRPQFPKVPLADQIYPTPDNLPYQLYNASDPFIRGPQSGFNQCNSTTETQDSKCQTAIVNDITDFCLWGGIEPNQIVANIEGEMVAWCTKKGHGTRVMPAGTLQAVQVLNAPGYVMITGQIDQSLLDLDPTDPGGEEDFGGQDLAGNPIGALIYSTHFDANQKLAQIRRWTEFIGSGQFCMRICKGADGRADELCRHTLDRIGLAYNCPSKFTIGAGSPAGTFEVCDSDDMTPPGVYTGADGVTSTYTQGPEGEPLNVPYTPTAAPSRNCQTFTSSAIYTDAAANTAAPSGSGSAAASGAAATGSAGGAATGSAGGAAASGSGSRGASGSVSASRTGSGASASATGASQANGAGALHVSAFAAVVGTFVATLMFA